MGIVPQSGTLVRGRRQPEPNTQSLGAKFGRKVWKSHARFVDVRRIFCLLALNGLVQLSEGELHNERFFAYLSPLSFRGIYLATFISVRPTGSFEAESDSSHARHASRRKHPSMFASIAPRRAFNLV